MNFFSRVFFFLQKVFSSFFFPKTIRTSTMHVLRMHVTETEDTQELRITLYFVFLLSCLQLIENLSLNVPERDSHQTAVFLEFATRSFVCAATFCAQRVFVGTEKATSIKSPWKPESVMSASCSYARRVRRFSLSCSQGFFFYSTLFFFSRFLLLRQ